MADNKGIMLAKSVQKHAGRAKEKILQNLGKVDRTADDIFDEHLNNFSRQQGHANRLQKEFNNYIRCIRATQAASKSLMDAISEVYEPHWVGFDSLQSQTGASESLWQDFSHKLADQVLIPLNTYTGQFPEMKKKIDKRNRKLIDYDGQRHSFQSLQANANKRKDDVKLTKGREQLEEARRTYEILNTELHDELPALYDSRILFLVTNLQTLFATEQVFHSETSKIYSEMEAIVDKLATDSQRGSNTLRKQTSKFMESPAFPATSPIKTPPFKQMNNTNNTDNSNYQNQITTNGSSNVNSPSSTSTSSSHHTSRLDSVSPTPESTTDNDTAAVLPNANALPPSSLESSPIIRNHSTPPTYQNAVELLSAVSNESTSNNSKIRDKTESHENVQISSPNANTKTEEGVEKKENGHNSSTETSDTIKQVVTNTNNDMLITTNPTLAPAQLSPLKGSEITERSNSAKKMAKPTPEQFNGNANNNVENDVAAKQSQVTPTSTTSTDMNNGNADETNNKKSGGKVNKKSPKRPKAQLLNPLNLIRKSRPNAQTPNQCESIDKCDITNEQLNTVNNVPQNIQKVETSVSKNPFEDDEEIYDIPNDATTSDLPPGVLYRVKATYGYVKEDVDELSFEVGDIIRVIEYDDPEDQEEGWLMGQKEGTTDKGLFPANFTRPI